VNGFDVARFPRGQIEDIELGYRLRDRGGRILLDPAIQGTHLKRWTFGVMVRTDIRDRGIPWMRLLLERGGGPAASLNATRFEQLKVVLAAGAAVALLAAAVARDARLAIAGGALLLLLMVSNVRTYAWFAAQRNWTFALLVVPLHLGYYFANAFAAAIGVLDHMIRPRRTAGASR